MKMFVPAGLAKFVHVYEPHSYIDDGGRKDYMVCIDAEYMKGFPEMDEYIAKTPHLAGKTTTKISTRKRPEVKTNEPYELLRECQLNEVRNRSKDMIFRERDIIVEFEIKPITPNRAGYKGFYLALVSVEINF